MTDASIVGAGPNGLAAAVILARAGLDVTVFEANDSIGGGARTREISAGFHHDWGSAVHPMALASPFFRAFALADRIPFVTPEVSYGHALGGERAAIAWRDLERTADALGADGNAWRRLFQPLVARGEKLTEFALSAMLPIPQHPLVFPAFATRVLRAGTLLHSSMFADASAPALLAGVIAHSVSRMPSMAATAPGLVLATLAHSTGWPIPRGGTQAITDALASDARAHGARIETGHQIARIEELPQSRVVLFDTDPAQLAGIAGDRLTPSYTRALRRFAHGNAASKVDFELSEPVPWANSDLHRAGTVHLGGAWAEVAGAENDVARGQYPQNPYVLVSQPTTHDPSRAPAGRHTLWTYTHVPAGSDRDMTETIVGRIEQYAPGFRDIVVRSLATPASEIAASDAAMVGGDFAGGAISLRQLVARPVLSSSPWRAGVGIYLCSASTVPGPGVHGMGGYHAARHALREVFGRDMPSLAPHAG